MRGNLWKSFRRGYIVKFRKEAADSPRDRHSGFPIARALLRHSPILLLDEATSALDMETEKRVLQNIMQDSYPRTGIVTTHRPSVLRQCTRVYGIRDRECILLSEEEIEALTAG